MDTFPRRAPHAISGSISSSEGSASLFRDVARPAVRIPLLFSLPVVRIRVFALRFGIRTCGSVVRAHADPYPRVDRRVVQRADPQVWTPINLACAHAKQGREMRN